MSRNQIRVEVVGRTPWSAAGGCPGGPAGFWIRALAATSFIFRAAPVSFALMCFGSTAWAEGPLEAPRVGWIADGRGQLREIYGVPGAFVQGQVEASGVVSAGCSESLCLAKTRDRILAGEKNVAAPEGPAMFAFDGDRALLYFPDSRKFAWWREDRLEVVEWSIAGEVLSARVSMAGPEIAVRRDGVTWIVSPDGGLLHSLACSGAVLLLGGGVLYSTEQGLVLGRRSGAEIHFELTGVSELFLLSPRFAAARANGTTYVIRLTEGHEEMFQLPEAAE